MTCTSLTSLGEPPEVCSGSNLFTWLRSLYYALCEALDDVLAATASGGIPVGVISDYAGATAPTGWLLCDGSAVSRTTYAALFTGIGTTYGAGDGVTTFNLPDLRGRVTVGKDNMGGTSANRITGSWADSLGGTGGAETHTLTTNEIPSHTHQSSATTSFVGGANVIYLNSGANSTHTSGSAGGGLAHNNLQPSIALNRIIKY